MKNVVVCFDRVHHQATGLPATNAGALFRLTEVSPDQLAWYERGAGLHRRSAAAEAARGSVAEAYRFLRDTWSPGDAIFVFGVGRGAACARELTRLLGTIGIWPSEETEVLDHLLTACVLPRTPRTSGDRLRISRLVAAITGRFDPAVPVRYLGLWDAVRVPGAARPAPGGLANVAAGRHAVAIDGGACGDLLDAETVEETWFHGAHCDIAGTRGACLELADIALDWVLAGAVRAGLRLHSGCRLPSPTEFDALAGSHHPLLLRKVPECAAVHASVAMLVRARPQYWRRLPTRFEWADTDWLARGERLVQAVPAAQPVSVDARGLATAS